MKKGLKILIIGVLACISYPLSGAIIGIIPAIISLIMASKLEKGLNIGLRILVGFFNVVSLLSVVVSILAIGMVIPKFF